MPGWRCGGAIQGKEGIKFCSVAKRSHTPASPKGQTQTILKSGYRHLATLVLTLRGRRRWRRHRVIRELGGRGRGGQRGVRSSVGAVVYSAVCVSIALLWRGRRGRRWDRVGCIRAGRGGAVVLIVVGSVIQRRSCKPRTSNKELFYPSINLSTIVF